MQEKVSVIRVFLSYNQKDDAFIQRINLYLKKQPHIRTYCHSEEQNIDQYQEKISTELATSDVFVLFLSEELGRTQKQEMNTAIKRIKMRILVQLTKEISEETDKTTALYIDGSGCVPILVKERGDSEAQFCAEQIMRHLGLNWIPDDDLPVGYPFDYEKDIIEEYLKGKGRLLGKGLKEGCCTVWPSIESNEPPRVDKNSLFSTDDLEDPANLAIKLRQGKDPLSSYLKSKLHPDSRHLLEALGFDPPSDELCKILIDELNQQLTNKDLYDEERFEHISLTDNTKRLATLKPDNDNLILLNRLLIEEAFPHELVRNHNPIPQEDIGSYRAAEAEILVDVRTKYYRYDANESTDQLKQILTLPEAGPRKIMFYPTDARRLDVGILVSGGIAPGINAVIDGIVSRHIQYAEAYKDKQTRNGWEPYDLTIRGYVEGFKSLLHTGVTNYRNLTRTEGGRILKQDWVAEQAHQGGSMLGTSRAGEFLNSDPGKRDEDISKAVESITNQGVQILYIIGGDGTMRAAHAIWKKAKDLRKSLSVVTIPKTMDNDILWVWQSFGFLSAVDKAKEAILQLRTEAKSNPRLCIIQLFGSDSGFIVSHAALASGSCDAVLIPEVEFTMKGLSHYILDKLSKRYYRGQREPRSAYGMIVMSETAIPSDVEEYINDPYYGPILQLHDEEKTAIQDFIRNGRRVRGQTPDALREGGLKIVSRVLAHNIQNKSNGLAKQNVYWETFRVFTNEPRHLIRAIPPSVSDVIFGERLGTLAVDNSMAGYSDFMVSQWLTEYVLVPLRLVVMGRKRIPQGIFWKSVLANTGQPAKM